MMNVAIVCPYDMKSPGGVQQLCHELANQIRASGDQALLIAPRTGRYHGGSGRDDTTIPVGRPFRVRANRSTVPLTLSPMSWIRMRDALADVDVVHIHEPMVPLAGWAALSSRKPMVLTFHADAPRWVERFYRTFPLIAGRMRTAVLTAVSESAKRSLPLKWGHVRTIPNAIDVASYDLPIGRVGRRIAFLGRDDPRKGLGIALDAFAMVRENHPDAELVVMGSARDSDLAGVRFAGRVGEGEKRRLLASSAIYVAPNTGGESFGIVLAEAMAAGCAVIASDLDAFRSVAGENAVYFPVGDTLALAHELNQLLDDEARRETLGATGKKDVASYDWSQVLASYRSAYIDALDIR